MPFFQVQRGKMILLAAEGFNDDALAARLDSRREIVGRWRKRIGGVGASVSPWLHQDAIRPWYHRSWPRTTPSCFCYAKGPSLSMAPAT